MLDSPKQKQLLGVGLLLLLALVGILRSTARPQMVTVDLRFIGYTNNASGVRLARFDIQNNSSVMIDRSTIWAAQVRTATGWSNLPGSQQQGSYQHLPGLPPGESEIIEVPVPNTTTPWRLSVMYFDHEYPFRKYLRFIQYQLRLKTHDDSVSYVFQSEEIPP